MAETRSKAKAKGTKNNTGDGDNFISTLSTKYKPQEKYIENDVDQYVPSVKKCKGSKMVLHEARHIISQSQPLSLGANNNYAVVDEESDDNETNIISEENSLHIECPIQEVSPAASCDSKIVDEFKSKACNKGNSSIGYTLNKDKVTDKSWSDADELICQSTDAIENDAPIAKEVQQTLSSAENGDIMEVQIEKDLVTTPNCTQSNHEKKETSPSKENSTCSCTIKLTSSHKKLVKVSEELTNINSIIEKIKRELEKYCSK